MQGSPDELETELQAAMDAESEDAEAQQSRSEERAAVKQSLKRIEEGRTIDKPERTRWKKWRQYVMGRGVGAKDDSDREWIVDSRLVHSTMQTLVPALYAQDPEPSVTPEESVSPSRYSQVKAFCETLEIVLSRLTRDADLKGVARRWVRAAMTTPGGWLKPQIQVDRTKDPEIVRKLRDAQDNLARLDMLLERVKDSPECATYEADRAEIAAQIIGLEAKVEVQKVKGLVIDIVAPEDVQTDGGLREIIDYKFGRFTAHRVWKKVDDACADFGFKKDKLTGATRYQTCDDDPSASKKDGTEAAELLACWEIHDMQTSTYAVVIEGTDFWAKAPYAPDPVGFRFTPLFGLFFHPVDGERWPMCDVEIWHKYQDEVSRRLSMAAEHRRRNLPGVLFDATNITESDIKKVTGSVTQEYTGVTPQRSDMPVSQSFSPKPYAPLDQATYDTSDIQRQFDRLGATDASSGSIQKAKTATEANILDEGQDQRQSDRRVVLEMALEELYRYIAELALQALTEEDAIAIAGPGAVWPKFTKEELYSLVSIRIRAGSTGRPNTKQQQEKWGELLPIISAGIDKIANLRAQAQGMAAGGDMDQATQIMAMAEAQTELLKETLRRADERIDIDKFLPPPMELKPPATPPPIPGAMPAPGMAAPVAPEQPALPTVQ